MGCGKSKHDVVAGNTVSQSKKSKDDHPSNNIDHGETTTIPDPPPPAVQQQEANIIARDGICNGDVMTNAKEGHKAALGGPTDGINYVKQLGEKLLAEAGDHQEGGRKEQASFDQPAADVSSSSVVIKESKNVDVNDEKAAKVMVTMAELDLKEIKKENMIIDDGTKEGEDQLVGGGNDGSAGTNSNNIEGVITDGLSGTTVYYSPPPPPHTNTKEVVVVVVEAEEIPKPAPADHHNLILADKESVQETKMETTNVEIVTVTEETSIQVEVNIPAVETKVSTNIDESDKVAIATN